MARGNRPAFSVGERTCTWRDVLEWARSSGELAELERETTTGLAAIERDGPPSHDDVRTAGSAFRYARGLLSADEMERWLARWELTTEDWLAHLRRTLGRERASAPSGNTRLLLARHHAAPESPPSHSPRLTSLAECECGLWLGADDPETGQHYLKGH